MIGTSEGCSKGIAPRRVKSWPDLGEKKGLPCQGRGIPRTGWVEAPRGLPPSLGSPEHWPGAWSWVSHRLDQSAS